MEVIALSLARGVFQSEGRERIRMRQYAEGVEHLHLVVCTRVTHGYTEVVHEGSLSLYPTNARTRVGMLIRAYQIIVGIRKNISVGDTCVITAQDPLEMGWLAYLLARMLGTRWHIQVHGDYFDSQWRAHSFIRVVKQWCGIILLRRAPAIRVVSERIKQSLVKRGVLASRVTVLPIRPELEHFLPFNTKPYTEGEPFVFLFVGRFAPEKHITRIISAFSDVHTRYPHTRLRLVGGGSEEGTLRAQVARYGLTDVVSFIPWTSAIAREMSNAHAFVLASKHEAYGLVLIEAMAVGLPLITTDVGCVDEVVRDGEHGIVVRDNSTASFAHAMVRMLEDSGARTSYARHAKATAQTLNHSTQETYRDAWVQTLSRAL